MDPYQSYGAHASRFASEFGFASPASVQAWDTAITNAIDRHPQSRIFCGHDKSPGNVRRYGMYLSENIRYSLDFDTYIYCCQLLQSEAMYVAVSSFRRKFKGPGNYGCSGVLIWQLNDIWPGTSWALVDYLKIPKPAYFAVKRALAPLMIDIKRVVSQNTPSPVRNYPSPGDVAEVWGFSTNIISEGWIISYEAFNIETGNPVDLGVPETEISMKGNKSTEIYRFPIANAEHTVVVAYLKSITDGVVAARCVSWPEPMKHLRFCHTPVVNVHLDENSVSISSNVPLKGVVLHVPPELSSVKFCDNCVDIVPNHIVKLSAPGLEKRRIQIRCLYDWEMNPLVRYS